MMYLQVVEIMLAKSDINNIVLPKEVKMLYDRESGTPYLVGEAQPIKKVQEQIHSNLYKTVTRKAWVNFSGPFAAQI